jgi:hypothetical protein
MADYVCINLLTTPPEERARSMSKVRMLASAIAFDDNLFTKPKQETPDHHSRDDCFRLASGSCVSLASRVDGNNLVTVPRLALLASPEAFFTQCRAVRDASGQAQQTQKQ